MGKALKKQVILHSYYIYQRHFTIVLAYKVSLEKLNNVQISQ